MTVSGQKIEISELKIGMVVDNVFNEHGILLLTKSTRISSLEQIESLHQQGIRSIVVLSGTQEDSATGAEGQNFSAGASDSDLAKNTDTVEPSFETYREKIAIAAANKQEMILKVKEAMADVKAGHAFSCAAISRATEEIVEQVLEDPDVFFGLNFFKSKHDQMYAHSVNVAIMAIALAQSINCSRDRILEIAIGALLHDIGKMRIPEAIWMKNGNFTRKEFEVFKQHPRLGIDILNDSHGKIPDVSRLIIGQHHERLSGAGYPLGLKDDEIDEIALLCALPDLYDMLTTQTAFYNALLPQEALAQIFQHAGIDYQRSMMEQFTRLLGIYPVGSFVKIVSGEKGLVIRINRRHLLQPVVAILIDTHGNFLAKPVVRDLSVTKQRPEIDKVNCRIERSLNPSAYQVDPSRYFAMAAQ